MCIRLNNIKECPKVAESDMIAYKVLEVIEDVATGKESYHSPFSHNKLQYNVGEQYTESIGKLEDINSVYDMKGSRFKVYEYVITTTGLYSYRDIDIAKKSLLALRCCPSIANYKIFRCKIPKGSKYYSSNKGDEIVSDNLVILNQI